MGYAKLFSSITESSLWSEPKEVRILFVSMLARADAAGFVEASVPGLARVSNLTLEETESSLEVLSSPDPHSKNDTADGRRIVKVDGGWCLVNYEDYRNRRDDNRKREYMREYMREYRKTSVNPRKTKKLTVRQQVKPNVLELAQAEAEAEAEAEKEGGCNGGNGGTHALHSPPRISLEKAVDYLTSEDLDPKPTPPYSLTEIRKAWLSLNANGWMWGQRPVSDPFSAISTKIEDNRERNPQKQERPNGPNI